MASSDRASDSQADNFENAEAKNKRGLESYPKIFKIIEEASVENKRKVNLYSNELITHLIIKGQLTSLPPDIGRLTNNQFTPGNWTVN